jgi:hypothetical protein
MNMQAFIESVEYQNKRLCEQLAQLESGVRTVRINGEDISAEEAQQIRHQVNENVTILLRLRSYEFDRAS